MAGVDDQRRRQPRARFSLPHLFFGSDERRDHLGFEEDDETSPLAPELRPMDTGVDENRRLKLANRRRALFAVVRDFFDVNRLHYHLDLKAHVETSLP